MRVITRPSGMTYDEALKILGFKHRPAAKELNNRIRQLAKKYHPDLHPKVDARLMRDVLEAQATLLQKEKERPTIKKFREVRQEYRALKQQLGREPTDHEAETIYARTLHKKHFRENPEASEKLATAYQYLQQQMHQAEQFEARRELAQKRNVRKYIMRQALPPEQRAMITIQEEKQAAAAKKSIDQMLIRLRTLLRVAVRKKGKPHVPIHVKPRTGHPYRKLILITVSLLVAILGGKYLFSKIRGAYIKRGPIKLLR